MFLEATNNIRRRVAIIGSVLIVSPMVVVVLAGWAILQRMEQVAASVDGPKASVAHVDLSQMAHSLVELCRKYHRASVEALKRGERILKEIGPIRLDGSHSSLWHAKNELTGQIKAFQVPLMMAGAVNFAPVTGFDQSAPAVDQITKTAGTLATVFQRLNDQGDMLRVASTEKSERGTRAIGTFIPAEGREGESAKVLEAVLSGKTYLGKEVRGKVSYLTAYQPLKNSWGKVVGVLNTVLPEEQIKTQVKHLAATSAASQEKPQLFILEASGENRGTALVMADNSFEGSNLWNEKDGLGRPYVQDMCSRATQLSGGELAEYKFQKANRVGGIPRTMTAQFAYVPELDWVVGFAQPEAEAKAAVPLVQVLVWAMWLLFGVSVASTSLALRIWLQFSDDLAPKLNSLLNHLRKDAKQLTEAAMELSEKTAALPTATKEDPPAVPIDQSALALRRQTETLMRLAQGIDRTVEVVTADLAVEQTESQDLVRQSSAHQVVKSGQPSLDVLP